VTPFYSLQFFKYAMGCLDSQKSGYELYRRFLEELLPAAVAVENANWNAPLNGVKYWRHCILRSVLDGIPAKWRRHAKLFLAPSLPSVYANCITEQFENCESLKANLDWAEVKPMIDRGSRTQIETVFTITSAIEEIVSGESSIKKYSDRIFQ
jgi:asparagine synthase (glutamine-hydrolysing)